MDQESFNAHFLQLIQQTLTGTNDLQSITNIKNHISNLNFICQFIPNCPREFSVMTIAFKFIKDILKNRGGLLDVDFLQQQISFLMNFVTSNADFIISAYALKRAAADAVAYSYRFLFELPIVTAQSNRERVDPPPFTMLFELFNAPQTSFKIFALEAMSGVVEAIKDKLHHLTDTQHQTVVTYFQRFQLSMYFQVAASVILNNQLSGLIEMALELLINCFKSFSNRPEITDIDTYHFVVPPDVFSFYQSDALPSALLDIFYFSEPGSKKEKNSMESLIYFASATDVIWHQLQNSQITFLVFAADRITKYIVDQRCIKTYQQGFPGTQSLLVTSRFIYKLGTIMPILQFFQNSQNVAVGFFVAVRDLTLFSFQSCFFADESNFLIMFWARLANGKFSVANVPTEFVSLFPAVFNAYINAIGNFNFGDNNEVALPEMVAFIESSKYLWEIAYISPLQCANYIANALSSLTKEIQSLNDTTNSALHKIQYIILTISGKFLIRLSHSYNLEEIINQHVTLISAIFGFIEVTNAGLKGLIDNYYPIIGKSLSLIEQSLKGFILYFKRDFILNPSPTADRIINMLPMCQNIPIESRRQFCFDILFNRFLFDLLYFQNYNTSLVLDILKFIEKNNGEFKKLVPNNAQLQTLIQRNFVFEFKQISDDSQQITIGKLYIILNKIYIRAIITDEQLALFLPYFDAKFNQLRSIQHNDDAMTYVLFHELGGVLKGSGLPTLFISVFRWFLNNYVGDTIECIHKHGSHPHILRAICKTWVAFCGNKGHKLIIPNSSAEGINLFKSSLLVIQAIASTPDTEEKMKYLIKIIDPSLSTRYVNFGIMKHFGDETFNDMVNIFFVIAGNWISCQIAISSMKMINSIIISIIDFLPDCLNTDFLRIIHMFIWKALLEEHNADNFKEVCQTIKRIYELFLTRYNGQLPAGFTEEFHRHFLLIMGQLINVPTQITDMVAAPLFYMIRCDTDWAAHVFSNICSLFDPKYRDEIGGLFEATFRIVSNAPEQDGIKTLRAALLPFKMKIRRFAVNLSDIPEFEPAFRFGC